MNPKKTQPRHRQDGIVLGGGLAGLSAAYVLSEAGWKTVVLENDQRVGGLSKTFNHKGYRYDIGGHRFFTKDKKLNDFVEKILGGDSLTVNRKSKIYMLGKYLEYPLKPANAILSLNIINTVLILTDYIKEKIVNIIKPRKIVSLEDWVVKHFGRKMFNLYFKGYSEKVWGIPCARISSDWISVRIKGLSLWKAVKNAFWKFSGKKIPTLLDKFIYPIYGIGELSEKLKESIESNKSRVETGTRVIKINHKNFQISEAVVQNGKKKYNIKGSEFISSIPLTSLVKMLSPKAPKDILEAASSLRYRDLVIVTVMLDRERITDLTWLYLPDKDIPFGRFHEPKNWSPEMVPEGKTSIVTEYFCFENDEIWNLSDKKLTDLTAKHLEKLGFIAKKDLLDSAVLRVVKAYPLFEVGYEIYHQKILDYFKNFKNLHLGGRGGLFQYYNMDHTIESGLEIGRSLVEKSKIQDN